MGRRWAGRKRLRGRLVPVASFCRGGGMVQVEDRRFITALVLSTEPVLARAARECDLGLPTGDEKRLGCYEDVVITFQWWTGGVVWCLEGEHDVAEVAVIRLPPPCAHKHIVCGKQTNWCEDCGYVFDARIGASSLQDG